MTLARHEGLEGHARAIEIRLEKEGTKAEWKWKQSEW